MKEKLRMAKATLDSSSGTSFGDVIERHLSQPHRAMTFVQINGRCELQASVSLACPNCRRRVPANVRHSCDARPRSADRGTHVSHTGVQTNDNGNS